MDERSELKRLSAKLDSLEQRIRNIETRMGAETKEVTTPDISLPEETQSRTATMATHTFESNMGGYGLAVIGNIVLLFGIIFLWQYLQKLHFTAMSFVFGYCAIAGMLLGSRYLESRVGKMASMFVLVSHALLYFFTLHLYFFSSTPVIPGKEVAIVLLFAVIGIEVYMSLKNKSQLYGAIAVVMIFITGVVSGTTYFMLSTAVIIAALSVFYFFRYAWRTTLLVSVLVSFSIFIIWLLNNPALLDESNVNVHHICNLILMSTAIAFSMITLVPPKDLFSKGFIMGAVLLYGISFSMVLVFFAFTFFAKSYIFLFVAISIFCMLFSIILKSYSAWDFSPAFYAMYGFVTISISIYGLVGLPYVFLFLAIQSLLVLAMSLWFRSLIIVGLNAAMFMTLLVTYLVTSSSVDVINFTFAVVAFLTARVLNLKKERLRLGTNYIRNGYLVIMFIMVLYSLQKALPDQYVTLSWTIAALGFFIFNLVLSNVKYRLMALSAIIFAAIRLFLMDLSRISFVYRVVAFLFLAIISISISIYYYTKMKGKTELEKTDDL